MGGSLSRPPGDHSHPGPGGRAPGASPAATSDHRVEVQADDELGVLVDSFNQDDGRARAQQGSSMEDGQSRAHGDQSAPCRGTSGHAAGGSPCGTSPRASSPSTRTNVVFLTCNDAAARACCGSARQRLCSGDSLRGRLEVTPSVAKLLPRSLTAPPERGEDPASDSLATLDSCLAASGKTFEVKITPLRNHRRRSVLRKGDRARRPHRAHQGPAAGGLE